MGNGERHHRQRKDKKMTEKERNKKAQEFRKLWSYSQKLKEGGKAWDKIMCQMENLKKEILSL